MKRALSVTAISLLLLPLGCKKDEKKDDDLQPAVVVKDKTEVVNADLPPGHPATGGGHSAPPPKAAPANEQGTGKVKETMNAAGYTYALLETKRGDVWIAGPQTSVKVGDTVGFQGGMLMEDFPSKTLGRTFDRVFFVGGFTLNGVAPKSASGHGKGKEVVEENKDDSKVVEVKTVAKATGGKNLTELFASKATLEGKSVSVRGTVVKFNPGIMGRNWIHLQDGTKGGKGFNDLTITTKGTAKLGDVVLIEGTVRLNKDFGAGYSYEIMLEDATVLVE